MLAKRIIPCLDIKDGRTVKGTNFVNLRDAGDPVELAANYARQGADELVFLDRAIPDALAYYRFLNLPVSQKLMDALEKVNYKKVFVLEILPLVQDYARKEDEAAQKKIHQLLIEVYESLGLPVVHVPVLHPEERVRFILSQL